MATGTLSRVGTESYFREICGGGLFAGEYRPQGKPFSTCLRIVAENADAALSEILEDVKRHEKALPYLDSYKKKELRQTVQGLSEGAELGFTPRQTAGEILRLIDEAARPGRRANTWNIPSVKG